MARERLSGSMDFVLHIFRKCALGTPIPIARIVEIAFHDMYDAMQPARVRRFVLLHYGMCLLPLTRFQVSEGGQ